MKKKIIALFSLLFIVALSTKANYKAAAIEALRFAQNMLEYKPLYAVKVRSFGKNILIDPARIDTVLDRDGTLPIHYSAQYGSPRDVARLLVWGANVNATNNWQQTPLMRAIEGNNLNTAAVLLEKGASLSQDQYPLTRFTPFHYAVITAHRQPHNAQTQAALIALLAEQDPTHQYINMKAKRYTPLELALDKHAPRIVIQALLNGGAQITETARNLAKKVRGMNELLEEAQQLPTMP